MIDSHPSEADDSAAAVSALARDAAVRIERRRQRDPPGRVATRRVRAALPIVTRGSGDETEEVVHAIDARRLGGVRELDVAILDGSTSCVSIPRCRRKVSNNCA